MHFEIVNTANPGPLIGSGTNVIYENVGEAITQLRCCAALFLPTGSREWTRTTGKNS